MTADLSGLQDHFLLMSIPPGHERFAVGQRSQFRSLEGVHEDLELVVTGVTDDRRVTGRGVEIHQLVAWKIASQQPLAKQEEAA